MQKEIKMTNGGSKAQACAMMRYSTTMRYDAMLTTKRYDAIWPARLWLSTPPYEGNTFRKHVKLHQFTILLHSAVKTTKSYYSAPKVGPVLQFIPSA